MYKYRNIKKYNYLLLGKKPFNIIKNQVKILAKLFNEKLYNLKRN